MNRLVEMPEIEIVGVVKAQPLSLSRQGKSRIRRHLQKVGWRFAWLLFFQRIVQGLGYGLSLLLPSRMPAGMSLANFGIASAFLRSVFCFFRGSSCFCTSEIVGSV